MDATINAKTSVFISYSRRDAAFRNRLATSLAEEGFDVIYDQNRLPHDNPFARLSPQDEWWKQLQHMITLSHVMVFVVSPSSARSRVCDDEIAFAKHLGKRVIPIIAKRVNFKRAPQRLRALNISLDFTLSRSFEAVLNELSHHINTDIDWHREASELMRQSMKWDSSGRPAGQLLSDTELLDFEKWLFRRPPSAPAVSELLVAFRDESRRALEEIAKTNERTREILISIDRTWDKIRDLSDTARGYDDLQREYAELIKRQMERTQTSIENLSTIEKTSEAARAALQSQREASLSDLKWLETIASETVHSISHRLRD